MNVINTPLETTNGIVMSEPSIPTMPTTDNYNDSDTDSELPDLTNDDDSGTDSVLSNLILAKISDGSNKKSENGYQCKFKIDFGLQCTYEFYEGCLFYDSPHKSNKLGWPFIVQDIKDPNSANIVVSECIVVNESHNSYSHILELVNHTSKIQIDENDYELCD